LKPSASPITGWTRKPTRGRAYLTRLLNTHPTNWNPEEVAVMWKPSLKSTSGARVVIRLRSRVLQLEAVKARHSLRHLSDAELDAALAAALADWLVSDQDACQAEARAASSYRVQRVGNPPQRQAALAHLTDSADQRSLALVLDELVAVPHESEWRRPISRALALPVLQGRRCPLADQVPPELGEARHHREHHAAHCAPRVHRGAAHVDEVQADVRLVPIGHLAQGVVRVPEQPVELEGGDLGRGAALHHVQQLRAALAVGQRHGAGHSLVGDHGEEIEAPHRTVGGQALALRVEAHALARLVGGRDPDVPDAVLHQGPRPYKTGRSCMEDTRR
jgi:hypothetical protein